MRKRLSLTLPAGNRPFFHCAKPYTNLTNTNPLATAGVFAFLRELLDNKPHMELLPAILPKPHSQRPVQGRDELNLADFPISVLQHQQPKDDTGRKLDTVVYQATRYDTHIRQRVPQRVTLTTSSRYGLPTPADEDVVLSLLCLGKRVDNFASNKVHFTPHDLSASCDGRPMLAAISASATCSGG